MTSHTGPVIFADETARKQLTTHGDVITFRTSERTTGKTWWRESRTGEKKGDCHIRMIYPVDPSNQDHLEPQLELSGFNTVEDWQTAIKSLNGELSDGFLYHVHLLSTTDTEGTDE